jgi:hypothetical protein
MLTSKAALSLIVKQNYTCTHLYEHLGFPACPMARRSALTKPVAGRAVLSMPQLPHLDSIALRG